MTQIQFTQSPMGRLILLIVFLSIAVSFVASMHYFIIDLPAQKEIHAPNNSKTQKMHVKPAN